MMKTTRLAAVILATVLSTSMVVPSFAENTDPPHPGKISARSVGAGLLSFLIWPGIGQAVNSEKGSKVATHAIAGLFPPVRFFSGYDALVDRSGGYFNGKL
jgi:hypothetical protein